MVGHCNNLTSLAASPCKRWLASGDSGQSTSVIGSVFDQVMPSQMCTLKRVRSRLRSKMCSLKTIKVWDIETRSGLQVIDGSFHPSLYSGVASIAFSSDSKTLIIVACDSTATFWKWTDDKPYLYGSKGK